MGTLAVFAKLQSLAYAHMTNNEKMMDLSNSLASTIEAGDCQVQLCEFEKFDKIFSEETTNIKPPNPALIKKLEELHERKSKNIKEYFSNVQTPILTDYEDQKPS